MSPLANFVLWILASPILLIQWTLEMMRRWRFWRTSYTAAIVCRNCGAQISLVGIFRCSCGFTYRGHLLRFCPICGSLPQMVRCFECGLTAKLPAP